MKLLKLKCPNSKCGKEFYCQEEDITPIREGDFYMICPFCVTRLLNYENNISLEISKKQARESDVLKMGEVEFDDKHKLSQKKIEAIRNRLEEVLHDVDNLNAGPDPDLWVADKEKANES